MAKRRDTGEIRAPGALPESPRDTSPAGLVELIRAAATQLALGGMLPPPSGPTFGELADRWMAAERKRLVAPQNEERHLKHLEWLRDMREHELSPRVAREALFSLLKPTGPLQAVTVNKVRSTAKRIIREAQIAGDWKGVNPFDVLHRLKERKPGYASLTMDEARDVLRYLRADRRREALVMMVLGPRPGELKALRKEDVDTARWLVTWQRSNGRDTTKTGRTRVVPIPDQLHQAFRDAIEASCTALVFPDADGQRQRHDAKLSRTLRTALAAAGIVSGYNLSCRRQGCGFRDHLTKEPETKPRCPSCGMKLWVHPVGRKIRWYDLRHSAATLHREAGCDPLVIKLALGHAARSVTDDVYTHLSENFMRVNLNKLARLW